MGFWDLFKGGKQRDAKPAPKVTSAAELVTVYDERGRELKITKADWLKSVLHPAIRKDWSDADKLYGHIVNGLRDDLAEHLLSAAERLVELDGESERSLVVHAIVLLQTNDLDGAEGALNDSIKQHGKSAVSLTNLAKVLDKREETEEARSRRFRIYSMNGRSSSCASACSKIGRIRPSMPKWSP